MTAYLLIKQSLINYLSPSYGIFFSEEIREFPGTPTLKSSLFTLHVVIWDMGSLLSPAIVRSFGHRATSLVALITTLFSFVLMAFIEGPEVLYIAFGIILGLSGGFLFNTTLLIVPLYFEKYRRTAFSVMTAGMGFSGVIIPRLVRYLMNVYGFSGGLLLYGACLFQGSVFVAFFDPHRDLELKNTESTENLQTKETSANDKFQLQDRCTCCGNNFALKLQVWIQDKYLAMRNQSVLLMAIGHSFFHSSLFNFYAYLPFILESHGYSPEFSARCISNSSFMSLASRMFIIFTIDHRWFHKRFLLVASTLIVCGINIGFTIALRYEKVLTALSLFYGLGIGMFFSIFYATLIDVVGLHLYQESLAVNALILILSDTVLSSFVGLIRSLTASYLPALGACAVMTFSAAVLLAFLFYRMKQRDANRSY